MKSPGFLMAAVAVAGLGSLAMLDTPQRIPASDPRLAYEGRRVVDPDGSVRVGFPGVRLHARFTGRHFTLLAGANKDTFIDVSIDGGPPRQVRLKAGEGSYPLATFASPAEHAVTLTRCNESWQGTFTLHGIELGEGGTLLSAPALPSRRLMFIGDSVTCGEMTAWTPVPEPARGSDANARLSYGIIVSRDLGAQCSLVSYGGKGIIRDWQGNRSEVTAPQFYERALPDDPALDWRHADYVPDAIGIQLGTNDFSRGIPDENEFVNAYVEFVRKVRRDAPAALIFLMDSPILTDTPLEGPKRTALHAYLAQVLERVADPRVIMAPLSHYPGVPGNGHPTGAEHVRMAAELEPLLRSRLGW